MVSRLPYGIVFVAPLHLCVLALKIFRRKFNSPSPPKTLNYFHELPHAGSGD